MIRFSPSLRAVGIVVVCALFSLSASRAWAQDDSHGPVPDTWALQFALAPNADIESFSGSALSVQRQFSATRALRLGVALNGRFESFEADNGGSSREQDRDVQSYELQSAYLAYLGGGNDIHAYAGAGPFLRYQQNERSAESGTQEQEQETVAVGALGLLGVEWFVRSNLSLLAEYRIDLEYARTTVTNSNDSPAPDAEIEETRFSFGGRGARVGISVYF